MRVALRERKLPSSKITLYLDIYHKGKRTLEYLGIYLDSNRETNKEKRRLAEKIRTKREVELQTLGYNFIPEYRKRQNFISYFEDIAKEYKNNTTLTNSITKLKEFKGNIITFEEIDEKWLEDFKRFLTKKVNQNSASTYFQKVKMVLKRAKMEKVISVNPADFVSGIKMIQSQRTYLEMHELEKLTKADCRNEQVKRAFLFSCFSGLRFSDIKKLTWNEIKGDQLQLQQQKTKDFIYLPIHSTALDILNKQKAIIDLQTNLVFTLPKKWWTNQILKEWCKKAKIDKNISMHCGRHTFATMNLTYGADIYTVSSLLDHKNIKTTQAYAKIIDSKKQSVIDSIPKLQLSS
jgi:integrase